jgi:hypothetical protein
LNSIWKLDHALLSFEENVEAKLRSTVGTAQRDDEVKELLCAKVNSTA